MLIEFLAGLEISILYESQEATPFLHQVIGRRVGRAERRQSVLCMTNAGYLQE